MNQGEIMVDNQGLALSSANPQAIDALNESMTALLSYRVSAMPLLKTALERDPTFCMAHCLRGYMFLMFSSFEVYDKARAALADARRHEGSANARESAHVQALQLWLDGDLQQACARWESILAEHPRDILALRLHHFTSFWMGRAAPLVSLPAAVLPAWNERLPNYGNVLGMIAFGLEENGQYERAERYGREAVTFNPDDLWAIHAVAHVFEMQGRHKDGIQWLDHPIVHWSDRNPFRGHLWWHLGLFLIEAGRLEEALVLYDQAIYDSKSDFYLDIQNAAAFLVRLQFKGVDIGSRWTVLGDHAQAHKDDHALAFTDIHRVISLGRAKRFDEARGLISSMKEYAAQGDLHVAQVLRRVGVPICEGVLAFEQGEYEKALRILMLHKSLVFEVGASNAQRQVISQYTIEAARRAGAQAVARQLLHEQEFMADLARPRKQIAQLPVEAP